MAHYASQNSYMATVFTDVAFAMVGGNAPEWYFNYVCLAKLKGFVGGYPDGSFRPTQKINFVEAAKIITIALGYEISPSTPWYKTYVEQLDAKNAIPTTIKSFNQNITRGEMAEMIWRIKAQVMDLSSTHYGDLK
jgi:2-keto-4-pentenoate hydratase/2-oxohepta-3-ene-1,7-dioic acid hydratase in catechol pathway